MPYLLGVAHYSLAYDADVRTNQAAMAAVRGGASQVNMAALRSDAVQLQQGSASTPVARSGPALRQGNEITAQVSIPVNFFGIGGELQRLPRPGVWRRVRSWPARAG